ncbi:MAG: FKBP-type peptidyl-prolyl cis-trans isomerase [bacterium]|nr:FKBP-type peptidyl-prolyl cis-trans isomerase [bacterium]
MNRRYALATAVILVFIGFACKPAAQAPEPKAQDTTELTSFAEKLSYTAGQDIGQSLKGRGSDMDLDMVIRGIRDAFDGKDPLLTPEEGAAIKQEYAAKIREERAAKMKAEGEQNLKAGEAFLAENGKKPGVVTTDSGLQYLVQEEGKGPKPLATDQVSVHYKGTLLDGTEFDSSHKRGRPATFGLNRVIRGWTEGLQLMSPGAKYRFFIPADLAYGPRGSGPKIGPNATLIFDVELLEIIDSQPKAGAPKG